MSDTEKMTVPRRHVPIRPEERLALCVDGDWHDLTFWMAEAADAERDRLRMKAIPNYPEVTPRQWSLAVLFDSPSSDPDGRNKT